jgi:hypothetical protein
MTTRFTFGSNSAESQSEVSDTSTRSLVKIRYQPSDDECDDTRQRAYSRVFGISKDSVQNNPLSYFQRALAEGLVEANVIGRRLRSQFSSVSTRPCKHVEYIIRVKVNSHQSISQFLIMLW